MTTLKEAIEAGNTRNEPIFDSFCRHSECGYCPVETAKEQTGANDCRSAFPAWYESNKDNEY